MINLIPGKLYRTSSHTMQVVYAKRVRPVTWLSGHSIVMFIELGDPLQGILDAVFLYQDQKVLIGQHDYWQLEGPL